MTPICAMLIAAAIQAAPPPADAPPPQPPVKGQYVQTAEKTPDTVAPTAPAGLEDEAAMLQQLQNEIRAILNASMPPALPTPAAPPAASTPHAEDATHADVPDALSAADALYSLGQYSEALSLYDRAKPTGKDDTCWIMFQKANSMRWLGKSDAAIAGYQKVIGEYPDSFLAVEAEWWLSATQWKMTYREN